MLRSILWSLYEQRTQYIYNEATYGCCEDAFICTPFVTLHFISSVSSSLRTSPAVLPWPPSPGILRWHKQLYRHNPAPMPWSAQDRHCGLPGPLPFGRLHLQRIFDRRGRPAAGCLSMQRAVGRWLSQASSQCQRACRGLHWWSCSRACRLRAGRLDPDSGHMSMLLLPLPGSSGRGVQLLDRIC